MVKILAAGDFHADTGIAKKLAEKAVKENVDLIILNGDIVEEDNVDNILGNFKATGKPVLLVPGNHDFLATDFLAEKYKLKNLHSKTAVYDGVGIIGCGGANIGLHMLTEDEIYDTIKKNEKKLEKTRKKLLITHVHPSETKMAEFSNFVPGSKGLKKAIDAFKPDIVLCGHVHEAEGIEEKVGKTTVINVGKNGKIIEI
ncbi:metallophosphoesterase family protein [Candidatus Woesearchaeota archaeon]|nr:metallophosphoesterase family protein [Candidatus Woesearchaeota archaeon]